MKLPLLAALAGLCLSLAPGSLRAQDHRVLAEPLSAGLNALQGTWTGKQTGTDGTCTLTVKGATLNFTGADGTTYQAAAFVVVGSEPAQLSAQINECSREEMKGKTALAIFKIEKGTLTLVSHLPGAPEAPKSFADAADSHTYVFQKAPAAR